MNSEIIQSVASDNYDDFQHVNFIFSQNFISLFWGLFNNEIDLRVRYQLLFTLVLTLFFFCCNVNFCYIDHAWIFWWHQFIKIYINHTFQFSTFVMSWLITLIFWLPLQFAIKLICLTIVIHCTFVFLFNYDFISFCCCQLSRSQKFNVSFGIWSWITFTMPPIEGICKLSLQ
jgi:hypothetical protein